MRNTVKILATFVAWIVVQHVAKADDLLDFLLKQNEASGAKIKTMSFHIEEQIEKKSPASTANSSGEVRRQGKLLFAVSNKSVRNKSTGKTVAIESRLVVNDKYAALWPSKENQYAYQYDHTSINDMDDEVSTKQSLHTPYDTIPFAFGDDYFTFREQLEKKIKLSAVEIKGDHGQTTYEVRRFAIPLEDPARPDSVWTLNPQKGFLADSLTTFKANGNVRISQELELKEIEPGIFFPVKFVQKHFGEPSDLTPLNEPTTTRTITLSNIRLNENFAANQFTIDALDLQKDKPDAVVFRKTLDGTTESLVYFDGALVPQKLKVQMERRIQSNVRDLRIPPVTSSPSGQPVALAPPAATDSSRHFWLVISIAGGLVAAAALAGIWYTKRKRA